MRNCEMNKETKIKELDAINVQIGEVEKRQQREMYDLEKLQKQELKELYQKRLQIRRELYDAPKVKNKVG